MVTAACASTAFLAVAFLPWFWHWTPLVAVGTNTVEVSGKQRDTITLETAQQSYMDCKYEQAFQEISQVIATSRKNHDDFGLANAYRIRGEIACAQGELEISKGCYLEAIRLTKSLGEEGRLPELLESLGSVESRMGQWENAEDNLQRALLGYFDQKDTGGQAMCYQSLGEHSIRQGDWRSARERLQNSMKRILGTDQTPRFFAVHSDLALVESHEGHPELAREHLLESLAYWRLKGHPRWIASTKLKLGVVELAMGQTQEAISHLTEARTLYGEVGDQFGREECDDRLSELTAL